MKIVLVEDDPEMQHLLQVVLGRAGHQVHVAEDGESGLPLLAEVNPELLLVDLGLPGMGGLEVIEKALAQLPRLVVIMVTANAAVETAVKAIKLGAFDYLTKPLDMAKLELALGMVEERLRLLGENQLLKEQLRQARGGYEYSTVDPKVKALLARVDKVAATESPVLITGEHGTGKEVLAKYLHSRSSRASESLVVVNCSALSEELLESELFGHTRGAFTGAHRDHQGYFEVADRGTLFLDEIGETSPRLQVKLLRVLQERQFTRVGETQLRTTGARIISATNRDLKSAIADGSLREDFYYRINVIGFHLPPLRERPADILHHFRRFVQEVATATNSASPRLSPELEQLLLAYRWPGNVRELRNIAERMTILAEGEVLTPEQLPEEILAAAEKPGEGSKDLRENRRLFEISFLTEQLLANRGNVAETARQVGVHPVALRQKLSRLGIDVERIRAGASG